MEYVVWSHSGVWSLELLRSLESGVIPETGIWSLESLRSLESGVWSHSGVWSLASGITPESDA